VIRNLALGSLAPMLDVARGASSAPSLFLLLKEGSLAILILGATLAMARIEGRGLWSYGLVGAHKARNLATGFIAGAVFFSLLVGLLVLAGNLFFDGWALPGVAIAGYALFWTSFDFIVAFVEETLFRGYLQYTLARGIGFWPAAAVCSVAFGLAHAPNPGEDPIGIVAIVLAGLFLSACVRLTGSLWWGIGFHAALDWAEDFVYGVTNSGNALSAGHLLASHPVGPASLSGGADGPEGSLIAVALISLLLAASAALLRRRSSRRNVDAPTRPDVS
jgi:uncharacterized protein